MKREYQDVHVAARRVSGPAALLTLTMAAIGASLAPGEANAWVQWVRYPYPAIDNPALSPTDNCRAVYKWGGPRKTERKPPYVPGFTVYYQLHEPYATQAWNTGNGMYVDEVWIGNPPAGVARSKAGSCWSLLPADRTPLQADQDYSGEVIDHDWPLELVIPRPGAVPITFPPPFPPPPPQFTKEQLDGFTITHTGPDGVKRHWVRGFRNIAQPSGDDLVDKLQMGWVLFRDKGTPK